MINQEVIDQHAEEAAFLWTQRDHATTAPQYRLKDLTKLDERVEAHLDGLRIAKDAGWKTAYAQLDQGRGEVFAAAVLAFEGGDRSLVEHVLDIGCSTPAFGRALISALGWIPAEISRPILNSLVEAADAEVRRVGIGGMAVHRIDPGNVLNVAIRGPNVSLAARVAKAAAELGRVDVIKALADRVDVEDSDCRFWCAWSARRLGDRSQRVTDTLRVIAQSDDRHAISAADILARSLPIEECRVWQGQLASAKPGLGLHIAGAAGDPYSMPEIIAAMEDPKLAQRAGAAFSSITGVHLTREKLDADPPAELDDEGAATIDADYAWPAPASVRKWWVRRSSDFRPGVRYLCGRPITATLLRQVLTHGAQNHRAAAALELGLQNPADVLFNIRERGSWQQRRLL